MKFKYATEHLEGRLAAAKLLVKAYSDDIDRYTSMRDRAVNDVEQIEEELKALPKS